MQPTILVFFFFVKIKSIYKQIKTSSRIDFNCGKTNIAHYTQNANNTIARNLQQKHTLSQQSVNPGLWVKFDPFPKEFPCLMPDLQLSIRASLILWIATVEQLLLTHVVLMLWIANACSCEFIALIGSCNFQSSWLVLTLRTWIPTIAGQHTKL